MGPYIIDVIFGGGGKIFLQSNSTSFNYFNGVFFSNAAKREWRRCDCSASGDSRAFLFASMKGGALSRAVLGDLCVLSYFINLKPDCKDLKA